MSILYKMLRPALFRIDPETAHGLAIKALRFGLIPRVAVPDDAVLRTTLCGMAFAHPVGLAAGFDKHAEAMGPLFDLGFSFIELGGVTPLPQPGNPRPRLFRVPSAQAVINRFGFNSVGADVFAQRLETYHAAHRQSHQAIGINLAKNKETADAADDYVKGVAAFAGKAAFLTVNVSSPNTPGLRDMQGRAALADLLDRVMKVRARVEQQGGGHTPVFLKIAPDIDDMQAQDIAEVALASGIDAMIVGNTTVSRPASIPADMAKETGGLSGKPLFTLSTEKLGLMYRLTGGKIPLIGCGGISSGADAYAKIRAGASLVQLYTAMIYEGPDVVRSIVAELAVLLKRDGFSTVADAVGADFKKEAAA